MKLVELPAFADNYLWLWQQDDQAVVVDPGDAAPVLQALAREGLILTAILVTHHHADHVGGVDELRAATGAQVFGPARENIPQPFTPVMASTKTHKLADGTDYYTINPLGYVPLLVLDDGTQLREGPAIVQYIADQAPDKHLAPPAGTMARYRLMEWLNFITSELHKGFSPLFNPAMPEEAKALARTKLSERLGWVDSQLEGKDYLMGDTFTVADGYLFTVAGWGKHVGVDIGGLKNLPLALIMIPMMVVFYISALAETNRPPFDLPEAESELVAGYQVEYSSSPYLMFMIGEYVSIVLMCAMLSVLFFGGWNPGFPTPFLESWPATAQSTFLFLVFFAKIIAWFFMFAMAKAIVPRYRYDQLMRLGWKVFLPLSLFWVVVVSGWLMFVTDKFATAPGSVML